jgi:hypothetical protein
MQFVDVGVWIENGCDYSEATEDPNRESNAKLIKARLVEGGPSAAAAAKPVTPKFVVGCQSDVWDGQENL